MMGIRSLEAKLIKNMSMVLQYSSSDAASLGRSGGACMPVITSGRRKSEYHKFKVSLGI